MLVGGVGGEGEGALSGEVCVIPESKTTQLSSMKDMTGSAQPGDLRNPNTASKSQVRSSSPILSAKREFLVHEYTAASQAPRVRAVD